MDDRQFGYIHHKIDVKQIKKLFFKFKKRFHIVMVVGALGLCGVVWIWTLEICDDGGFWIWL
jgi:hypothetical protein